MKACINQDTLRTTPTDMFLRTTKSSGFVAVEFTLDKIEDLLEKGAVHETKNLIDEQGLGTASINGPENFNLLGERDFTELLGHTLDIVAVARELDCDLLIAVPSPAREGMSQEATISQTAASLTRLADQCGPNIRLGLEFLGMHECSINNLNAATETIRRVGKRNVGLILDTFHIYLSDSKLSDVSKLKAKQVFLVHVNDSEPGDKGKLTDANRLYPGEGVIDLQAFASTLRNIGYDDYLSLELIRPEYWKQDAEAVAARGRESLKQIFGV